MTSPDERIVALLKEARKQLEIERSRRSEPIAIVGIGCRFPGGAEDPDTFWQLLRGGVDATSEVPADRWDADAFYDADPEAPGKAYTKRASFLKRVDAFDADFFGISPREALGMDPQQRLLLEVVWEALEDAGIPPNRLRGSATGVWVGLCLDDYARRSLLSGDSTEIDAYNTLGNTRSIAAGRISYVLDLQGPAVQLDTACSSSLVALHQACQSLRSRECELALVGGVNLMLAPESTIALCKLRALAPDGSCKTFDASADGYGRGEGCGFVVLERLADARAAGHRIYAVVRGSASNHDGHSNGLTAPNGLAQEAVIRAALANGGVDASTVGYVEAHGTGTLLGDPIEVLALNRVYGRGRAAQHPALYLGAVKTNFGHLEGAAGVAGLIKAAICLMHGEIPPNLHLRNPNPKIPWADLAIRVASESVEWPRNNVPRIAGVSSFGISGTNAHVVLEEAPAVEQGASAPVRTAELVVLSAKTPEALSAAAGRLREHLASHPELSLGDTAYSLVTTRSLLEQRLTLSVRTRETLLEGLQAAAQGQTPIGARRGAVGTSPGKLAWLFTGQGAQRLGMGRELYGEWPVFREAFAGVCALFEPLLEVPLREVMWAEEGSSRAALLDQTGYTQPALFALEWALASLWRSWGVEPELLLGHSIGEVAAATVAGIFSLEDAVKLVGARARLMQALPRGGAMVSIAASEEQVRPALRATTRVSLAAVNGPSSVVIAGSEREVSALAESFRSRGVQTKRLTVSHAFHSPLMEPMLEAFREVAESLSYHSARIPLVADTTGALGGSGMASAEYWVRHVRETVRFGPGVQALAQAGADTYLELGPKPTLLGLVPACLPEQEPVLLAALRPTRSEPEAVLEALGGWVVRGGSAEWRGVFPSGGRRVPLPTYPWQRKRFWIDNPRRPTSVSSSIEIDALLRQLAERGRLSGVAQSALPEILTALTDERAAAHLDRVISGWFHAISWQPIRPASLVSPAVAGAWALLGPSEDLNGLRAGLLRAGGTTHLTDLDHLPELLENQGTIKGVIHVANPSENPQNQVLALQQLLASTASAPRAWWITRGGVGTSPRDPPTCPAQAVVWGLGRTFALEHPETWGGVIDLPRGAISDSTGAQVVRILARAHGEDQLALRSDQILAPRIVPRELDGPHPMPISGAGTALISGGFGALGLHVARWLAQQGVRHLTLVGRHGAGTRGGPESVRELQSLGVEVTIAAADVADREAMTRVLQAIPAAHPLTSIFHIAGINDFTPLRELSPERLAEVLAAKQEGALLLDDLTREQPLEAFVCFSSIAGVWGAGGQAAYAAANTFLDAWAHAARARGRAAYSLSWGPWADGGMADQSALAQLERRGLHAMEPRLALCAMQRALRAAPAHTTIVHVDWQLFRRSFEAWGPRAMLQALEGRDREIPIQTSRSAVAETLAGLSGSERTAYVRTWITDQCAAILGHHGDVRLDPERGFFDLGMDSLMIVELRSRIERSMGWRFPPGVVFSHPNIASLAEYLLQRGPIANADLSVEAAVDPAMAPGEVPTRLQQPAQTDEELIQFINSKFGDDDEVE